MLGSGPLLRVVSCFSVLGRVDWSLVGNESIGMLSARRPRPPGEEAVARASGADLVLLAEVLLLAVALRRLGADLLVVLLERREVLGWRLIDLAPLVG